MSNLHRIPTIEELREHLLKEETTYKGPLLCFDPGETTGMAYFEDFRLISCDEISTPNIADSIRQIYNIIEKYGGPIVVYENYRVYKWKAQSHVNEDLHTPKLIGAIESAACLNSRIPISQMASQAKQFADDKKLKAWGMYEKGKKHGRDAVRHGLLFYFVTYPKWVKSNSPKMR